MKQCLQNFIARLIGQAPKREQKKKVTLPEYYLVDGYDSMDFMLSVAEENGCTQRETFYLCSTLKYLIRYKRKNGYEDLEKAEDYLLRLMEEVEQ